MKPTAGTTVGTRATALHRTAQAMTFMSCVLVAGGLLLMRISPTRTAHALEPYATPVVMTGFGLALLALPIVIIGIAVSLFRRSRPGAEEASAVRAESTR